MPGNYLTRALPRDGFVRMDFGEIWDRIERHTGQESLQVRGGTFRYNIAGSSLRSERTNRLMLKGSPLPSRLRVLRQSADSPG